MTKESPKTGPAGRPAPSEQALERGVQARQRADERRKTRRRSPQVRLTETEPGAVLLHGGTSDDELHQDLLCDALGTTSDEFAHTFQKQLLGATKAAQESSDAIARAINEGLAFVAGVQPENEVEACLAAQMWTVHRTFMDVSGRVARADYLEQAQGYGSLLVKLGRTFTAQTEALAKLRAGGKQQVEVRYVYVDARHSQNLISAAGGGGLCASGGQPHAPAVPGLPFAPGVPMWGEHSQGDPVPVARDPGPEALPDARRQEPGRAQGEEERKLAARSAHPGRDRT